MKASFLSCGLAAALVGCGGMDQSYTPPSRGPMVSDRTTQVPPPSPSTWQQNQNGPSAYRTPNASGNVIGAGAQASPTPGPQLLPGDSLRAAGPAGPQTPYGGSAPNLIPTSPNAPVAATRPGEPNMTGFSGIQRVGYEESVGQQQPPPLRGVPTDSLPRPDVVRNASTPGVNPVAPKPLLMANAEVESPVKTQQAFRPLASNNDVRESPRPMPPVPQPLAPLPPASIPHMEEKEIPSVVPSKVEERPASANGGPPVRMVNSKRVVMNYELKDVGPSGVSLVEMWVTRDGRTWQKDESGRSGPPYTIEVPEEGMYGFTIVAKNGVGVGKTPPVPGDLPQVWVEVDLSKPKVNLTDIKLGNGSKSREVTITWDANDRNLARRPITILYAERPEGPWQPMAANIENTGKFIWTIPTTGPGSFYTRVEAADLVGNVGVACSAKPTSIDMSQPSVSILGVEPGEK